VFMTLDTPNWYNWLVNHRPGHRQIRKTILQFCGIDPVRITPLAPVRHSTPEQRRKWLDQIRHAARRP
jgi:NAD(P)H dehydrogenase (quinone)